MTDSEKNKTPQDSKNCQIADESMTVSRDGSNVRINLVGFDKPLITAIAISLSILSILLSAIVYFETQRSIDMSNYWLQRSENYLENLDQKGLNVPKDLLHKEK